MFSGSIRDRAWLQQLSFDCAKFEMIDFWALNPNVLWIHSTLVLRKEGRQNQDETFL